MQECWRTRSCVDTDSSCEVLSSRILTCSKDSFPLLLFTLWLLLYFWSLFWDGSLAWGDVGGDISDQHLFSVLGAFVSFNVNSCTQHKETWLMKSGIYCASWIYQYGDNSNFCTIGKVRVNFIPGTYELLSLGFQALVVVPGIHFFYERHIKFTQKMAGYHHDIPATIACMSISTYVGHY